MALKKSLKYEKVETLRKISIAAGITYLILTAAVRRDGHFVILSRKGGTLGFGREGNFHEEGKREFSAGQME